MKSTDQASTTDPVVIDWVDVDIKTNALKALPRYSQEQLDKLARRENQIREQQGVTS